MQAPNRTTELMSAAGDEGKSPGWHSASSPPLLSQPEEAAASEPLHLALPTHSGPRPAVQDTDSGGGGDGQDGASGN